MPVDSRELEHLLSASAEERERAWQAFIAAHSRLLLHVARTTYHDRDEAMDAYTFILDELRGKEFARLRAFSANGQSKFSTWLVVVARRLCSDLRRQRYGRTRDVSSEWARQERLFRRRLHSFAGEDIELAGLTAPLARIDDELTAREARDALATAVDALTPADRLLLKLRFDDDLPAQHIAKLLHLPSPFHVYRRLDALTKTLRRALEQRGVERVTSE
jgi:RNA polymerase sigma factor (sigma-70 family)